MHVNAGREKKIIVIVINRPTTTTTTTHGVSYTGLGGTAAARLERIKSIWSLRAAASPYSPAHRALRRSVCVRQSSSARLLTTATAAACSPRLLHTQTVRSRSHSLTRSIPHTCSLTRTRARNTPGSRPLSDAHDEINNKQ